MNNNELESRPLVVTLFNPLSLPFGALSSKSVVDFTVNSKDSVPRAQGVWQNVTQFVYVNMFADQEQRQKMSESLAVAFPTMLELHTESDSGLFENAVAFGLKRRFEQNKKLLADLRSTANSVLVYPDNNILTTLDQIRFPKNTIYDNVTNRFVPKDEVASVLAGLETALTKTDRLSASDSSDSVWSLDDDTPFLELGKFAKRVPDTVFNTDLTGIDINMLVLEAKKRVEDRRFDTELGIFKTGLLNTYLDYILEKEYPYLESSLYNRAKEEQLAKEPVAKVSMYKEQLYNMYLRGPVGNSEDDQVLSRVGPFPETATYPKLTTFKKSIILEESSPFLPQYQDPVNINGKTYNTVIHYAYYKLLSNLNDIFPLTPDMWFDVNSVNIDSLVKQYAAVKNKWVTYVLRVNNEIAIDAKLRQDPSLAHLLLATGDVELVWNDALDPVLGVGNDGNGENITGQCLMFFRKTLAIQASNLSNLILGPSMVGNVVTSTWFLATALDYRNTLMLLAKPSYKDLETVYGQVGIQTRRPDRSETLVLKNAGLTDVHIAAAFPVLLAQFEVEMRGKQIKNVVNFQAEKYFRELQTFATLYSENRKAFLSDLQTAQYVLERVADLLNLAEGVTSTQFVDTVLAGKQVQADDCPAPKWSRVAIWSRIAV